MRPPRPMGPATRPRRPSVTDESDEAEADGESEGDAEEGSDDESDQSRDESLAESRG